MYSLAIMRIQHRGPAFRRYLLSAGMFVALLLGLGIRSFLPTVSAQGWEPAIRDFEEQDKAHPPKPGCIVFAGSSSIRFWDTLVSDMKPLDVINRGFGGSEFSDLDEYANRIVSPTTRARWSSMKGTTTSRRAPPRRPKWSRETSENSSRSCMARCRTPGSTSCPSSRPSCAWNQWPAMKAANKLMQDYAATQQRVQYIDIATTMFDANGNLPATCSSPMACTRPPKLYAMWTGDHQANPAPAISALGTEFR